jgi:hypothetical protein
MKVLNLDGSVDFSLRTDRWRVGAHRLALLEWSSSQDHVPRFDLRSTTPPVMRGRIQARHLCNRDLTG